MLDIGLDIDNVLYPWATVMARWTERSIGLAPGSLDDIALSWTWYKDQWGMGTEAFMQHFTAGVHAGVIFAQGDPTPGSLAAVRRLARQGHRIHYISNREIPGVTKEHAWRVTHRWLREHGFPGPDLYGSITISADKSVVPTDLFLDDSPDNVRALVDVGHPHPLLWDQPHNQGGSVPGAVRVHSWHGFERVVETIATLPPPTRAAQAPDTLEAAPKTKDAA